MKIVQYFAVWQISFGGQVFMPAAPGETPRALIGLPEDEVVRLLEMGAIRKMVYDDGIAQEDPAAKEAAAKEAAAQEAAAKEAAAQEAAAKEAAAQEAAAKKAAAQEAAAKKAAAQEAAAKKAAAQEAAAKEDAK